MKLFSTNSSTPPMFWAEMAPCHHMVQIYEEEGAFLDTLEGFVSGGLRSGDGVVIIATPAHRHALEERLAAAGFDLDTASDDDQLFVLDASDTLAKFMNNGWPDDERFKTLVNDLLVRAGGNGRRVRAFGEMVALLWERGHCAATVRLEHLWHAVCKESGFSLLCSYPKTGFTKDASASIKEICEAHSHVLSSNDSYSLTPVDRTQ